MSRASEIDSLPATLAKGSDHIETLRGPNSEAITTEPSSGQNNKRPQKAKQQFGRMATKNHLFHETLSAAVGQTSIRDDSGLDPVNVLNRLTYSTSQPNLRPSVYDHCQDSETNVSIASSDDSSGKERRKFKYDGNTYTLDHFAALFALGSLIEKYGRISHMGILDPSYSFFMNTARNAALYYKVKDKVAVVGGDPLCRQKQWPELLTEFARYRKKKSLGIAYVGATDQFAKYATEQEGWVSMRFGRERALNPLNNKVLLELESKRLVSKMKQLLDPARGGMKVKIYVPSQKQDLDIQSQLLAVYESWRQNRNQGDGPQAYMTIFDPFAIPKLMVYIYSCGPDDKPNGFAALRRVDATGGFHIDPYCALPDAPKGTSDLLIYSALALLNRARIPYLGLGFEPSAELSDIHGLSAPMTRIVQSAYRRTWSRLPISGKKAFHDKWHPESKLDAGLYIIYPEGRPDLHHALATLHFANVFARHVMKAEIRELFVKYKTKKDMVGDTQTANNAIEPKSLKASSEDTIISSSGDERPSHSMHDGIINASRLSLQLGAGNMWDSTKYTDARTAIHAL